MDYFNKYGTVIASCIKQRRTQEQIFLEQIKTLPYNKWQLMSIKAYYK